MVQTPIGTKSVKFSFYVCASNIDPINNVKLAKWRNSNILQCINSTGYVRSPYLSKLFMVQTPIGTKSVKFSFYVCASNIDPINNVRSEERSDGNEFQCRRSTDY